MPDIASPVSPSDQPDDRSERDSHDQELDASPDGSGSVRDHPGDPTTLHVRRAVAGSRPSFCWLVSRFTPLLLAQATTRMPESLLSYEPQDLVSEVWMDAEPVLGKLQPRDARLTPVLVRFLSRMLLHRVNRRMVSEIRYRTHLQQSPPASADSDALSLGQMASLNESSVPNDLGRLVREEAVGSVHAAIGELSEEDRQVVVMRAIEQRPWSEIALVLRQKPNTLAARFSRALGKLRARLDRSVFDDLPDC